jgi:hypothetical protein
MAHFMKSKNDKFLEFFETHFWKLWKYLCYFACNIVYWREIQELRFWTKVQQTSSLDRYGYRLYTYTANCHWHDLKIARASVQRRFNKWWQYSIWHGKLERIRQNNLRTSLQKAESCIRPTYFIFQLFQQSLDDLKNIMSPHFFIIIIIILVILEAKRNKEPRTVACTLIPKRIK